jgi:RimJ/RimL family protein N-acetyltransferase
MSIQVREATLEDAADMGRIHVAAWRAAYAGLMPAEFLDELDEVHFEANWVRHVSEQEGQPWLAELRGKVVAMTSFGPYRDRSNGDPSGELYMLNCDPEAFGTGAATALLAQGVRQLRLAPHSTAALWVATGNPRARRFYEREGWSADGRIRTEKFGGSDLDETRYSITL